MKYIFLPLLVFSINATAQELNPFYQSVVEQVKYDSVHQKLQKFQDFGIKTVGSSAHENAFTWLKSYYTAYGYTSIEKQSVNVYGNVGNNLIVTKIGKKYPDEFIIIDGHYDTLNGPGANDNGSGTVILLEIARLIKDIDTDYSIKFIHFTGEERGLIGSQAYVNQIAVPQNLKIKAVLNIDEVGGVANKVNSTIVCEQDESNPTSNNAISAELTNKMANIFPLYTTLKTEISNAYSSDYMPFQAVGYPITGLFEKNETPYAHTAQDIIDNMDLNYLTEVAKGALATLLHFSQAQEKLTTTDHTISTLQVYPNPVKNYLYFSQTLQQPRITIYNEVGVQVYDKKFQTAVSQINLEHLTTGVYFINVNSNQYHSKIIKK
ncbi:M20/M25/M40 family metallo-hydrolase [Empedobacter sp. GD03861]|uniref:M20/M25/M40 family metallo-hydrolase n=1 Tax=Empedobacter sp. GD03861 TaxID=2975390 RepID=UPI002448E6A4|nr:M20/M25/M40 family metallo-hydrolase [Empedobacter sp. GD03861]MDH0675665.1 M20/M25/M40 family metallo-hydrolase [Empedobacter sp. GD03861]